MDTILYGAVFLFTLAIVWSFVGFVFQALWTGLIVGLLLAVFICWFLRGLMRDIDRGLEGLVEQLSGRH